MRDDVTSDLPQGAPVALPSSRWSVAVVGFARGIVFVRAVGATDVGDTYTRANTVPNIVFETVAGGALASSVVPVLAGPADDGDREQTLRTTAALLTWTVVLLAARRCSRRACWPIR